jgi:rubrerythrin
MNDTLIKEARKALTAEIKLQDYYREMSQKAQNPKVKNVLHDLLLMEEMNEVLLRSLGQRLGF